MYVHRFKKVKCPNPDCNKKFVPYFQSENPWFNLDLIPGRDQGIPKICPHCGKTFLVYVNFHEEVLPVGVKIPENGVEIAPPQK